MKVVILCGGQGTRIRELTDLIPKPMVDIGGKPIVWHIMHSYAQFGITDFILALGYKGEMIKNYFLNYQNLSNDFTVNLKNGSVNIHKSVSSNKDWNISLIDTGENAMTGSRIKQLEPFIDEEYFCVTYGDGLSNIDINEEIKFHKTHGKIATLVGVNPPSRFGEIVIGENNSITEFVEKAETSGTQGYINGGFYVFKKDVFNYLSIDHSCVLEQKPLENLVRDNELQVFKHEGFWQCMDTYREFQILNELVEESPWLNAK
jgi:glucose-1-phosphate cytidylyltransferase